VDDNAITATTVYMLLNFFYIIYYPIDSLINKLNDSFKLYRLDDIYILEKLKIKIPKNKVYFDVVNFNKLSFERVCYSYTPERLVLNNITFSINKGEIYAMVGPSGIGKTTIARLILKLLQVDRGIIEIDGFLLNEINTEYIRNHIAYISQEPLFLDLPLGYNINMENLHNNQIDPYIDRTLLRERVNKIGVDNKIGVNASIFSGGEKQRLGIIRGLVKDAKIVILDEPTSALDISAEKKLMELIHTECRDKIVLIIAHRLTTINMANCILVMGNQGEIVERGTHEYLLTKQGVYHDMWIKYNSLLKNT
jgi:ABC-type multidrug transport system fused ATPase/permease subunit